MFEGYASRRAVTPAEIAAFGTEARIGALRFMITRVTDYSMRKGIGERVMKDYRRFWQRHERIDALGDAGRAIAVGDVAAAAYVVGEATHLLAGAARYAADRVQFKNAIGNFQAIAHPLADCHLRLSAARTVTRIAAHAVDVDDQHAAAAAATARRSATNAALETAYHAHQTYGAMGFTVEGPIGNRSARIRQTSLAGHRPGAGADLILRQRGL
jgi:alkylation response protein AidB-like acyl-CoA dehydrogenase